MMHQASVRDGPSWLWLVVRHQVGPCMMGGRLILSRLLLCHFVPRLPVSPVLVQATGGHAVTRGVGVGVGLACGQEQ